MAEAELPTIARPYARAAFSYALDQSEGLGQWSRMLLLLAGAISEPVVQDALDNPLLTTEEETKLLLQLMGDDLDEAGRNFIGVLAEYDRLALLPTISEMFELLKANHEKTMDVEVTSAFEVSDQEKNELKIALKRMLQREINLETEVDKSLIGGVVIKAEDTVIDDSVRGRLAKLSQALS
ncbi:MAG: F-type H+-transporting ATPase subunit delta [Candidatus Azotimanducaceae bacterium]|jgi:F-type H+-transporting ATPase subunit delta